MPGKHLTTVLHPHPKALSFHRDFYLIYLYCSNNTLNFVLFSPFYYDSSLFPFEKEIYNTFCIERIKLIRMSRLWYFFFKLSELFLFDGKFSTVALTL
jgi:hypothetical protein